MDFDFEIDFDIDDFSDVQGEEKLSTRICKPKLPKAIGKVGYNNAKKLSKALNLNERSFCIIYGKFIFGDLIEALIIENNLKVKYMFVSTLSMSQENVDSFAALLHSDKVIDELELIVSNYFFSHERTKLIPYIYKTCDIDNKFQLGVARTHTKICLFETYCGKFITIHGSANLRSSENYEQIMIENDKDFYQFNLDFHKELMSQYSTIKKHK